MAKKEKEVKEKKTSYFKAMRSELKKVTWPTPKELVNNTVAVISFVLIIALIVFVLDTCFNEANKGVTKLQEKVQTSFNPDEESSEEDSNSENTEGESEEENEGSSTEVDVEDNSEDQTEAESSNE